METGAPLWTPMPVNETSLASVVCLAPMKPFMAPLAPAQSLGPHSSPERIPNPPIDQPSLALCSILFPVSVRIVTPVVIALSGVPF